MPQRQDDKTTRRQDATTRRQDDKLSDKTTRRQLSLDLTEKQYEILNYIYNKRPFKISGSKGIGALLKIPYGSVRSSLRGLVKKHYISKPYGLNIETEKYSTCKVNYEKCIPLFGETKIINPHEKPTKWILQQDDKTTRRQDDKTIPLIVVVVI